MAAGYACQFGEDNHGAAILITFLDTGATITTCRDDMSPALINLIAVDLGCDPERFYASVQRIVAAEAKRQAAEAAKGTPDTGPEGTADGSGEPTPPPVSGRDVLLASLAGDLADSIPADDDA